MCTTPCTSLDVFLTIPRLALDKVIGNTCSMENSRDLDLKTAAVWERIFKERTREAWLDHNCRTLMNKCDSECFRDALKRLDELNCQPPPTPPLTMQMFLEAHQRAAALPRPRHGECPPPTGYVSRAEFNRLFPNAPEIHKPCLDLPRLPSTLPLADFNEHSDD